jgi:hypothetical protein
MVAFNKYNFFIDEMSKGGHNLQGSPVLKIALTNTAPTPLTDTVWSTGVYPRPAAVNGYPTGTTDGNTITISSAATATYIFKLVLADTVFTASGGTIGPFQYAILYNTTASNKVIGYYNYGTSITLQDTETFTVDFDPTTGAIQMTMTP